MNTCFTLWQILGTILCIPVLIACICAILAVLSAIFDFFLSMNHNMSSVQCRLNMLDMDIAKLKNTRRKK